MKKAHHFRERQVDETPLLLQTTRRRHLDGRCFKSARGLLGVALKPRSIPRLIGLSPSHWLVPLEDIGMVRQAECLPGTVLWLSTQPPVRVLGRLSEDVRGAWLEDGSVVVNFDGHPRRLEPLERPSPTTLLDDIAAAAVGLWKAGVAAPLTSVRKPHARREALCSCAA
jgi:hypothetical protein